MVASRAMNEAMSPRVGTYLFLSVRQSGGGGVMLPFDCESKAPFGNVQVEMNLGKPLGR